jgi:hypothetical protein
MASAGEYSRVSTSMLWGLGFYVRKGIAYVPTRAITEAGYLDVEPVAVAAVADFETFRRAIYDALRRGNPTVPTPTRAKFPVPVVLKYAKARSWSAFEKGISNLSAKSRG